MNYGFKLWQNFLLRLKIEKYHKNTIKSWHLLSQCDCYIVFPGAFLVPYLLMLVVLGIPLLYMELTVGQYTRRGPVHALAIVCPLFKGTMWHE